MAWLILLAIIVYIALSDAALRSLAEAEPMRNTPRRTSRYDEGVCEIVVKDSEGHYYHFIFKSDRMVQVFGAALKYAEGEELGFDRADAIAVARGLGLCLQNIPKAKGA